MHAPEIDEIINIIKQVSTTGERVEIGPDTHLIKTGVLDSIDVVELSTRLQARFAVEIANNDVNPAKFSTARQISALIRP